MASKVDDARVESWMGNLLRFGVLLATLVLLVGGALYLLRDGAELTDWQSFRGEPVALRRPVLIVTDVLTLDANAVIQFGLLILIATPIARVAFALIMFLWNRDAVFAVMTLVVLVLLISSLLTGTV